MKKPIIHNLFPIPIYNTELERDLTEEEINFVIMKKNIARIIQAILIQKIVIF